MTNPVSVASSAWVLSVSNLAGVPMAAGTTTNQFLAVCGATCRDCTNSSFCLSCYNNPSVNNLIYLDAGANTCVSACGSNQYLLNNHCYDCNAACNTCSLFPSNCTSCNSSMFLHSQTCISACPDGYYQVSTSCIACTSPCLTCSSAAACSSCLSGFVLLSNGTCETACLSSEFNYSGVCTACPANCSSCSSSGCSSCSSGNFLFSTPFLICVP